MRFQKSNSDGGQSHRDGVVTEKPNDVTVANSLAEEYRKSLDLLADVFSDLPQSNNVPTEANTTESDQEEEDGISGHPSPSTVGDILTQLSQGGLSDCHKNGTVQDFVTDANIDWSTTSSKTLLQLVHTDHPYLSKSQEIDDNQQQPVQSTSCSSIPDAELIHDFFLHTTNMIEYRPIAEFANQPLPNTATTLIGCPHPQSLTHLLPPVSEKSNRDGSEASDKHGALCTSDGDSDTNKGIGQCQCDEMMHQDPKTTTPVYTQLGDKNTPPLGTSGGVMNFENTRNNINVFTSENSQYTNLTEKKDMSKNCTEHQHSTDHQHSREHQMQEESAPNKEPVSFSLVQSQSLDQWSAACKAVTDKVQEDILLSCALTLMLKVWTDYLSLTFEEVRQREIETARELNYCEEVIEMLEDKDRYVWQIIEEMEPRNFCMDF